MTRQTQGGSTASHNNSTYSTVKRCNGATLCATYAMQGATNQVYDVCMQVSRASWTCMCPDFLQHHHDCKHIYFVHNHTLAPSVSALSHECPVTLTPHKLIWITASHGNTITAITRATPTQAPLTSVNIQGDTIVTTKDAHHQYRQAKRTWLSHSSNEGNVPTPAVRQSIKGRTCPICLDDLDKAAQLVFCDTCSNAAHAEWGTTGVETM
jgi:hypothetical protein